MTIHPYFLVSFVPSFFSFAKVIIEITERFQGKSAEKWKHFLAHCYGFLQKYVENNPENQLSLFSYFDYLCSNATRRIGIGRLLYAILENNRDLVASITESQVCFTQSYLS